MTARCVRGAIVSFVAGLTMLAPDGRAATEPETPAKPEDPAAEAEGAEGSEGATPAAPVTITGDAQPIAAQLSLRAGAELGRKLGLKASETCIGTSNILVTNRTDITALTAEYRLFRREVKRRTEAAERALEEIGELIEEVTGKQYAMVAAVPISELAVADAVLKGVTGLIGYFKSDYTIASHNVNPHDEVVLAGAANELGIRAVREGWTLATDDAAPLKDLDNLKLSVANGVRLAASLENHESKMEGPQKKKLGELKTELAEHATFVVASLQPATGGKPGLLQRILNADAILKHEPKYVLYAKFLQAGAMAVSRTHMFTLNPRLTFVGVATIAYTLSDAAGYIRFSGTGICNWPMPRTKLQDVGVDLNLFNTPRNKDLDCRLDSSSMEPAVSPLAETEQNP
jgi:hypothetical protein